MEAEGPTPMVVNFEDANLNKLLSKPQIRRIPVPPHRMTPLKDNWEEIVKVIVEKLKLQIRMNLKTKAIELRTSTHTT